MGLTDQTVSVAPRLPPPVTREEEPFCLHIGGFCVNKTKLSTFHCQRLVLLAIPEVLICTAFVGEGNLSISGVQSRVRGHIDWFLHFGIHNVTVSPMFHHRSLS